MLKALKHYIRVFRSKSKTRMEHTAHLEDLSRTPISSKMAESSVKDSSLSAAGAAGTTNDDTQTQRGACASERSQLIMEPYFQQRKIWPSRGRHILAQYDDKTIVVYQAFNHDIAKYAVEHQQFGGPHFSYERMSWIKTNFLWMMYRCGWASKQNQERVLAVRITREGFEQILANAYTPQVQKEAGLSTGEISVRLQWDPDHLPNYDKCERRAIQLGMKGKILEKYGKEWVVSIEDVTDFVKDQYRYVQVKDLQKLRTPRERVFIPESSKTNEQIQLDTGELMEGQFE